MLALVKDYHDYLTSEAVDAGRFRLPLMFLRMCLCLTLVAAGGIVASLLSLDTGARLALMIPLGGITIATLLHLGYVFTEGHSETA